MKAGLIDFKRMEDFKSGLYWNVVSCMGIARLLKEQIDPSIHRNASPMPCK
jgi:hypothetical protein